MELLTGRTSGRTSGEISGGVTWIAAAVAAQQMNVSLRTIRRWIASGRVLGKIEGGPGHETRYVRADTLPPLSGEVMGDESGRADDWPDDRGRVRPESPPCPCCTVRAEEIQHLRAQAERRDRAEAELRRLMAALSEANRTLTGLLEQKALPPAREGTPRRVKWWGWWRR